MKSAALALVALGCAHPPLPTPGRDEQLWDVGVGVAAGDRTLLAEYTLASERSSADVWAFRTLRTVGTWQDDRTVSAYDSVVPDPADPWPLSLQHAVASVPAEVRMANGRPMELLDAEAWSSAAHAAMVALPLPPEAIETGLPLLDPAGLLADLARCFPGVPEGERWQRPERIAGVAATIDEQCAVEDDRHERTWTCTGTASAQAGADARLFEVKTTVRLLADRDGLKALDTSYNGTLVTLAPGGGGVVDRPVSGLRRVVRR